MSAVGLIDEGQAGDDPERVREGMSGNICRCGAYRGITEAVLEAQKLLAERDRRNAGVVRAIFRAVFGCGSFGP